MRLVKFTNLDERRCLAEFEQDGERIEKVIRASSKDEFMWTTLRRSREAYLDFAFNKYGDKWREHVRGKFWDGPTEAEKKMIEDGLAASGN